MADEFKKGDVVKLKSGGPLMTVSQIADHYGQQKIWCVWFEKTKKHEDNFDPEVLVKTSTGGGGSFSVVRG